MSYLDLRHPFFLPLWRRVAVTGALMSWTGVEMTVGSPLFGVLVGALAVYCLYHLFWRFDPKAFGDKNKT